MAETGGDVDLGAVTLGGGRVEWQIPAVEVEEEGEWQTQRKAQKKAIGVEKGNQKKVDGMRAVVKEDGEARGLAGHASNV